MDDPVFQYEGLVFDQAEGEFKTLQEFLSINAKNLVKEHTEYTDYHDKQQKDYHPAYLDAMYYAEGDYIDVYLEGLGKYGTAFPRILLYSIIIMACSSFESNLPFLSIPTAASHDGIVSSRASIMVNGKRKSLTAKQNLP